MYNAIPTTIPNAPTRGENTPPSTPAKTSGTIPIPRGTAQGATRKGLQVPSVGKLVTSGEKDVLYY